MVDKKDINSILKGILRYINDIELIITENDIDKNKYENSILFKHSLHMCLFQIGELTTYISEDYKQVNKDVPWAEMKGLRNVEAHDYDNLDLNAIWETIVSDIPKLKEKLVKMIK